MINQLVSVIVPTYNRVAVILETINSILSQTYKNFELIIIDDGSTDDTEKIVNNVGDDRIRYFRTENWGGPARPRNIGIKKSIGKYIAFCDDDDIWLPDKLENQVSILEESEAAICFTNYGHVNNRGVVTGLNKSVNKGSGDINFKEYYKSLGWIVNSTVVVKKEVFDEIGGFCEDRRLIGVEDFHMWARILYYYNAESIDRVLVYYRYSSTNSIGNTGAIEWIYRDIYLMMIISRYIKVDILQITYKLIKVIVFFGLRVLTK